MKPTYHNCEQYGPEYWKLRRGVPTASSFDRIITPAKGELSKAADKYIAQLIGERIDPGYPRLDGPTNDHIKRGHRVEPEVRKLYEFEQDLEVQQVGFVVSHCGRFGCSPDALVGEDGLLEVKSPCHEVQVERILLGRLPDEFKPQLHGQLIVTGRSWVDWISYCANTKPLIIRVVPDEYTKTLRIALEQFWDKYQIALKKVMP